MMRLFCRIDELTAEVQEVLERQRKREQDPREHQHDREYGFRACQFADAALKTLSQARQRLFGEDRPDNKPLATDENVQQLEARFRKMADAHLLDYMDVADGVMSVADDLCEMVLHRLYGDALTWSSREYLNW